MNELIVVEKEENNEKKYNNYNNKNNKNNKNNNSNEVLIASVLVLLILFIVIYLIIYILNIPKDKNDNINNTTIIKNEINNITPRNKIIKSYSEIDETNPILKTLANEFNNCATSIYMKNQGYQMDAVTIGNKLIIESYGDGLSFSINFILEDNILYSEIEFDEDILVSYIKFNLANVLIDCIAQQKNYSEGALIRALNSYDNNQFTLEKDGLEFKTSDDNQILNIKVDLNSNFPFIIE